ncbi:hypothetical protein COL72_27605 [Bacillus toyonensis]|uniref:fascin domain-containing protein n=1 Tax=Bacillus toyonensis TaxID=155322 RepID=UPI000BFA43A4|nr:hypothetical protein [Bacillus toyonensis]PFZ68066.1 hypothetical protein COL72_27605 [Bacillus toyonensis]
MNKLLNQYLHTSNSSKPYQIDRPTLGRVVIKTNNNKYAHFSSSPFSPIFVPNEFESDYLSGFQMVPMPWESENAFCLRTSNLYWVTAESPDGFLRNSGMSIGNAQRFELIDEEADGMLKLIFSPSAQKYVRIDHNVLKADALTIKDAEKFEVIQFH